MRFLKSAGHTERRYIHPFDRLSESVMENCILANDSVRARPGVFARPEDQIFNNYGNLDSEMSMIATQCYLYVNGRYCRVAVSVADNLTDNVTYNMRLVYTDGQVQEIGRIEFVRASFDQFGRPESFTVFSGKPTVGCGVYFIARQVYSTGYSDFVRVMELNSDMNGWIMISDSNMYYPTVLANGRGEAYYSAAPQGEYLDLAAPVMPESRNMLCAGFLCYYTADSSSSGFTLPYSRLDSSPVECDFSYEGSVYSWRIESDQTASSAVSVGASEVTMHCNRTSGRIWFTGSDSNLWAPYYTGALNNIKVKAFKTYAEDAIAVASMSACCRLDGDALGTDFKATAFYSSQLYPSTVLFNSPVHPLYFPESGRRVLGEPQLRVVNMLMKDRCLLAVKENEVYAAEVAGAFEAAGTAVSELGAKSNAGLYELDFKRVAELTGTPLEKSIVLLNGDVIYVTQAGQVCRLYGSGTAVHKTEKLGKSPFSDISDVFAVTEGGRYLLISGKETLVMQKRGSGYFFSSWSLPERAEDGFSYMGHTVLFAVLNDRGMYLVYPARFSGTNDCLITTDGSSLTLKSQAVSAECRFPLFVRACRKTRIDRIRVDGSGEKAELILWDEDKKLAVRDCRFSSNGGHACGFTVRYPAVGIRFSSDTDIRGIAVEYRTLNTM